MRKTLLKDRIVETALTFDDVMLLPGYSDTVARDVETNTRLTANIPLNIPLLSAAMDTVTEYSMAIALAQQGGIGVIHKNMSAQHQADMVRRVKKYESGVVYDPITIQANASLPELMALKDQYNISGVPVLAGDALVGIVTNRDIHYTNDSTLKVESLMTPKERLVTAPEGTAITEIKKLLNEHRIEKILVVDSHFKLRGMITARDIDVAQRYPQATKDDDGRLRVAAAIGTPDPEEHSDALVEAGVDALVVDTAHAHSQNVIQLVQLLKKRHQVDLIAGNVATTQAAEMLVKEGVDAIKVGIGPGSICTTRIISGVGVPQLSAIANVVSVTASKDVCVIADGGIRYSGDIVKALAAGADTIMIGNLFAGVEESPGAVEIYGGRSYKVYRGMGSLGALSATHNARDRYSQDHIEHTEKLVPEGIEGRSPFKGPLSDIVQQLIGGVRAGMGYTGCRTIAQLQSDALFTRITTAGVYESHVHDIDITKESPNYPRG